MSKFCMSNTYSLNDNFLLTFKGRGPGLNSSQSKNVGKIQLSMQLSHSSIIFENIWVLMIIINSDFWHGMS